MLTGDESRIRYNSKFDSYLRRIDALSPRQIDSVRSHLLNLERGRSVMTAFGFVEQETTFTRGQPETEFKGTGDNSNIGVYLTGLSHWQVFIGGAMKKGTRYTDNLKATLMKVCEFDEALI